jgi:hypothetical protein
MGKVEPRRALIVQIRPRAFRQLFGALRVSANEPGIPDRADSARVRGPPRGPDHLRREGRSAATKPRAERSPGVIRPSAERGCCAPCETLLDRVSGREPAAVIATRRVARTARASCDRHNSSTRRATLTRCSRSSTLGLRPRRRWPVRPRPWRDPPRVPLDENAAAPRPSFAPSRRRARFERQPRRPALMPNPDAYAVLALFVPDRGQVRHRIGITRVDFQRPTVGRCRLGKPALASEDHAEVVMVNGF